MTVLSKARWIWLDYITPWATTGEYRHERIAGLKPSEKNKFGLFRRTFSLPGEIISAKLDITADGRYEVFVNGHYTGRGIYRCNKHCWYVDTHDISRFLRAGKNVICVVVQFLGEKMSWYEPMPHGGIAGRGIGKGGLLFEAAVDTESGKIAIPSDSATRACPCDAWQQDVPLIHVGLPFVEIFDARRFPWGWLEPAFDDAGQEWDHVLELPLNGIFPELVPCDITRLAEGKRRAKSITSAGIIKDYFDEEDIYNSLTDPASDPIDFFVQAGKSNFSSTTDEPVSMWTSGKPVIVELDGETEGIVFDMGEEVTGFVYIDVTATEPGTTIDMAWGEKLDPARDGKLPLVRAFKEKNGSRYICKQGDNVHRLFHWFGLRYLQLNVKGHGTLTIRDVGMVLYNYPVQQIGSFSCDDDRINKLYAACVRTLRACMHDGYEDCPSREQRQWIGDAYVEILVNFATFGDTALAKKLVKQCAQSQRGDGLTEMCCPGDHEIHGLLIHDYCLYWMNIVYQYYWYTGDVALVEEMMPSMVKAMRWFAKHVDPATGLAKNLPNWTFIDWSTNDKWGACCALNAHLYNTVRQLVEMGRLVGWERAIDGFDGIAEGIAKGINHFLWDEERGAYVDAVEVGIDGSVSRRSKKVTFHANALAILHGIAPPHRVERVVSSVFDRSYKDMYVKNARPLWAGVTAPQLQEERHVVVAEPFFFHHVNQALAKIGRHDVIARFLRDGWCKMLDLGATTVWETWGDSGSLCHAWSATPAHDLARYCLGIQLAKPGGMALTIAPSTMGLSWAEGSVPLACGHVRVRWEHHAASRSLCIDVSLPPGVEAQFRPPVIDGCHAIGEQRENPRLGFSTRVIFKYT